jgi:predicted ATPase
MIRELEVDGYRLLDHFSADLDALTVVIGANAVGKSTLLDCLQCIAQCVEFPLNTVLGWHGGMLSLLNVAEERERKLTWRLMFARPKTGFWAQMHMEEEHALVYEVALQSDISGQAKAQYEVLKTSEPYPGHRDPLKFLEATLYRKNIFSRATHRLEPFDDAATYPLFDQKTDDFPRNDKELPSQAQEPALMLSQIRFFNEFPTPSAARLLLANMTFYPGFDVSRYSPLRTKPAEIKPITTLFSSGENLGTVLHEIITRYEYRSSANDLRDFLKAAYPMFDEIHCDTTYGTPAQVLARVREKGMSRSMELWELSDGMLRFLCLATALLNPFTPPLVAIDEPEAGLHPRLLPIVADLIKTAAERMQVLVTTHSPDLLSQFDITNVAVMTRDWEAAKAKWHRPSDRKSLVEMLKGVQGETLGDLHRSGELETLG